MTIQLYSEEFIKITDQTSTTSTLAPDDILQFYMVPLQSYKIEVFIPFEVSGILPVYKWKFTSPSNPAPSKIIIASQLMVAGTSTITAGTYSDYDTVSTPTLTSNSGILKINMLVKNYIDSGTFAFNFACGNGTSVTNLAGAYIKYTYGSDI